MKITFDLTIFEAQQVLRCCELGKMIGLLSYSTQVADLHPIIKDLGKVVLEMMEKDSSFGPTGPARLVGVEKKVYIGREPARCSECESDQHATRWVKNTAETGAITWTCPRCGRTKKEDE